MADERPERRLAAILAADVVGYSRLIRTDEEGTIAASLRSTPCLAIRVPPVRVCC